MSNRAQLEWDDISVAAEGGDPDKLLLKENTVSWSYSKRNNLEQCPRRYYYEYYGASARHAATDPQKSLLRELVKQQNRYERTGEIVHHTIATALRNAANPAAFDPGRLERDAREEWQKTLQPAPAPVNHANQGAAEPPGGASRLIEIVRPTAQSWTQLAEAEDRMVCAVRNFARAEEFAVVRSAAAHPSARIERRFSIRMQGRPAIGIVDFAAHTKEVPGIVDWKTGAVDPGGGKSAAFGLCALGRNRIRHPRQCG